MLPKLKNNFLNTQGSKEVTGIRGALDTGVCVRAWNVMNLIRAKSRTASNHVHSEDNETFKTGILIACVSAKGVVKVLRPNLSQSQHSNPPPPVTTMLFEQRTLPPAEKRHGGVGCLVPMEPNNELPEYTRKHNMREPASLSSEM